MWNLAHRFLEIASIRRTKAKLHRLFILARVDKLKILAMIRKREKTYEKLSYEEIAFKEFEAFFGEFKTEFKI